MIPSCYNQHEKNSEEDEQASLAVSLEAYL